MAGNEPPFFLPLQELLGRRGFDQADGSFQCCGTFNGEMRHRNELTQLSPRTKKNEHFRRPVTAKEATVTHQHRRSIWM
jgi:hypothetical protein